MSDEQLQARICSELDRLHARIDEMAVIVATHVAESSAMAQDLHELVDVWRARKILGVILGGVAAVAGVAWQLIGWAKDHVRL